MSLIFDTHAHYDDEAFDADRETLLASMPEHGVGRILDPGCDLEKCGMQKTTMTDEEDYRGKHHICRYCEICF